MMSFSGHWVPKNTPPRGAERDTNMRSYQDTTPRMLVARFSSVCPETGETIRKGDTCAYYPAERKAYSFNSRASTQVREIEFARVYCMADANY